MCDEMSDQINLPWGARICSPMLGLHVLHQKHAREMAVQLQRARDKAVKTSGLGGYYGETAWIPQGNAQPEAVPVLCSNCLAELNSGKG